jgi:hypothetical protein
MQVCLMPRQPDRNNHRKSDLEQIRRLKRQEKAARRAAKKSTTK